MANWFKTTNIWLLMNHEMVYINQLNGLCHINIGMHCKLRNFGREQELKLKAMLTTRLFSMD